MARCEAVLVLQDQRRGGGHRDLACSRLNALLWIEQGWERTISEPQVLATATGTRLCGSGISSVSYLDCRNQNGKTCVLLKLIAEKLNNNNNYDKETPS